MYYILLLCSTFASAVKALVCKKIGGGTTENWIVFRLNSLIFLGASVIIACYALLSGSGFHLSPVSLLLAVMFATTLYLTQLTQTFAMRHGPASITSLIYSLGFLLPIFYSAIFLDERISVLQVCGMIVAIVSLFFIIDLKCDKKMGRLWLLFSFLACIGSGSSSIIQKIHRSKTPVEEIPAFLVLTLSLAAVLSFLLSVITVYCQRKSRSETKFKVAPISRSDVLFNLLFSGTIVGVLNILSLTLAGKLPAIIQFPVANIGSLILVGLGGKFLFHDKVTFKQNIGFLIGCCAILMIGLL